MTAKGCAREKYTLIREYFSHKWHIIDIKVSKKEEEKTLKNEQTLTKQNNNKNPARITSVKREEEQRTKQ